MAQYNKWQLHHFSLEVAEDEIFSIMKNQFTARDWIKETRGLVLVPMGNERERQTFLKNQFAGNAGSILDMFMKEILQSNN
jgi:hypothetical protein